MPFVKVNVSEDIKRKCEEDAEFKKEYEKLNQRYSQMSDEEKKAFWLSETIE